MYGGKVQNIKADQQVGYILARV